MVVISYYTDKSAFPHILFYTQDSAEQYYSFCDISY